MLTRVSIKNYKSLADVDVKLGPLTVLVGQNSSGKSNFIDALHFLSDAISGGLDGAILERGGISAIRCATDQINHNIISLALQLQFEEEAGEYQLDLVERDSEYQIRYEKGTVAEIGYEIEEGTAKSVDGLPDWASQWDDRTRLLLPLATRSSFDKVLLFLRRASYYSIFPDRLRAPEKPGYSGQLMEKAYNMNSVLRRIKKDSAEDFQKLIEAFKRMAPGITGIDVELIGGFLVVKLQYQYGNKHESFDLSQESDGTIRLLAILTALFQVPTPPLITIEEPELTVHPGALKTLYEVIEEASYRTQIIVTTHSPDLISYCNPENIRLVEKVDGMTRISPLEQRQIDIVNDQLFSTGDLLRIEGLRPQRQG